jgi:hypothetical protein
MKMLSLIDNLTLYSKDFLLAESSYHKPMAKKKRVTE